MKKIKIIFENEFVMLTKKRVFIVIFTITSILLSLFVLLSINKIMVFAYSEGNIEYEKLLKLYETIWNIIFIISIIFSIFLSSMTINLDKKKNKIDNLLATDINKIELILGKFFASVVASIAFSAICIPICMIPTFLGGINYLRMLIMFLFLIIILCVVVSISIMLSSIFLSENISFFLSILIGGIFIVLSFFYKNLIVGNTTYFIIVCSILLIINVICIIKSVNSRFFY